METLHLEARLGDILLSLQQNLCKTLLFNVLWKRCSQPVKVSSYHRETSHTWA